jgi:hypothetical protein
MNLSPSVEILLLYASLPSDPPTSIPTGGWWVKTIPKSELQVNTNHCLDVRGLTLAGLFCSMDRVLPHQLLLRLGSEPPFFLALGSGWNTDMIRTAGRSTYHAPPFAVCDFKASPTANLRGEAQAPFFVGGITMGNACQQDRIGAQQHSGLAIVLRLSGHSLGNTELRKAVLPSSAPAWDVKNVAIEFWVEMKPFGCDLSHTPANSVPSECSFSARSLVHPIRVVFSGGCHREARTFGCFSTKVSSRIQPD